MGTFSSSPLVELLRTSCIRRIVIATDCRITDSLVHHIRRDTALITSVASGMPETTFPVRLVLINARVSLALPSP